MLTVLVAAPVIAIVAGLGFGIYTLSSLTHRDQQLCLVRTTPQPKDGRTVYWDVKTDCGDLRVVANIVVNRQQAAGIASSLQVGHRYDMTLVGLGEHREIVGAIPR